MATTTPNLNLNKPDVGGDANVWGTQLNANADILDTEVTANTTAISDLDTAQQQLLVDMLNLQEPIGMVKYFNSSAAIPAGWAECDGTNGTPDLRERVIVAVAPNDLGRERGSKIWSQNSVTGSTNEVSGHAHNLSEANTALFSGNTGGTALTRAHLPAEGLNIPGAGFFVTPDVGNISQYIDKSGGDAEYQRQVGPKTENMGSGAEHSHNMTHSHSLQGNTTENGGHKHNVSVLLGATHGVRAIQKIRLLTTDDLPGAA